MDAALCLVGVARPLCAHFNAEISVETFSSLHRRSTAFVIVYNTRFICIQIDHKCVFLFPISLKGKIMQSIAIDYRLTISGSIILDFFPLVL